MCAPTLTGVAERSHQASESITLSSHIDDVVNEIKWKDLDSIVLVEHSCGGMVITGVAEGMRERIAAIGLSRRVRAAGQAFSIISGQ
jgi:hypothetical protein